MTDKTLTEKIKSIKNVSILKDPNTYDEIYDIIWVKIQELVASGVDMIYSFDYDWQIYAIGDLEIRFGSANSYIYYKGEEIMEEHHAYMQPRKDKLQNSIRDYLGKSRKIQKENAISEFSKYITENRR